MAFEDIIKRAIQSEEEAYAFYDRASNIVKSEQAKTVLKELRDQEKAHKAKLMTILEKGPSWAVPLGRVDQTLDLKIGEHAMPGELTSKSDFQDALLVAIRREESSHDFYASLADMVSKDAKPLFDFLANEESKHRNQVQSIYDEVVYQNF